jgi:hypothetical protein
LKSAAFLTFSVWLLASSPQTPTPSPAEASASPSPSPAAEVLTPDAMRSRERNVLIAVSTIVHAERSYAQGNGGFFDEVRCLTHPAECRPGTPPDTAPFLDPTYAWLEPRLGYTRAFHAGPRPTPEEIERAGASPTSLKAFAFTAAPLQPGVTGTRGFCGDSGGRLCFTTDGREPPVKDGRCDPCKKME